MKGRKEGRKEEKRRESVYVCVCVCVCACVCVCERVEMYLYIGEHITTLFLRFCKKRKPEMKIRIYTTTYKKEEKQKTKKIKSN